MDETLPLPKKKKICTEEENIFCIQRVHLQKRKKEPPIVLHGVEMSMGRDSQAHILIRSDCVSRKHVLLSRREKRWFITDTMSMNGVWVNKRQLTPLVAQELRKGDLFSLGGNTDISEFCYVFTSLLDNTLSSPKKVSQEDPEKMKLFDERVETLQRQLKEKELAEKMLQDKILAQEKEYQERLEAEMNSKQELQLRLEMEEQTLRNTLMAQRSTLLREKEKVEQELRQKLTQEMEEPLRKEQHRLNNELVQSSMKAQLLEQQLSKSKDQENQSRSEMMHHFGNLLETELNCSICSELFVQACTLGCSHTFCKHCITLWKKKKNECPICRTKIKSMAHALVLDNFIEQMVNNLSPNLREQRAKVLSERGAQPMTCVTEVQNQGQSASTSNTSAVHVALMPTTSTVAAPVAQSQPRILLRPVNQAGLPPQIQAMLGSSTGTANTFRLVTVNGQQTLQLVSDGASTNVPANLVPAQTLRVVGAPIVTNMVTLPPQPLGIVRPQTLPRGGVQTRGGARTRGAQQTTLVAARLAAPTTSRIQTGPTQRMPTQTTARGGGVRTRGGARTRGAHNSADPSVVNRSILRPSQDAAAASVSASSTANSVPFGTIGAPLLSFTVGTGVNTSCPSQNAACASASASSTANSVPVGTIGAPLLSFTVSTGVDTTPTIEIESSITQSVSSENSRNENSERSTYSPSNVSWVTSGESSNQSSEATSSVESSVVSAVGNDSENAIVISDTDGSLQRDSFTENSSDSDDYVPRYVNGRYYGGYGRCYRCGEKGHWANGCSD